MAEKSKDKRVHLIGAQFFLINYETSCSSIVYPEMLLILCNCLYHSVSNMLASIQRDPPCRKLLLDNRPSVIVTTNYSVIFVVKCNYFKEYF